MVSYELWEMAKISSLPLNENIDKVLYQPTNLYRKKNQKEYSIFDDRQKLRAVHHELKIQLNACFSISSDDTLSPNSRANSMFAWNMRTERIGNWKKAYTWRGSMNVGAINFLLTLDITAFILLKYLDPSWEFRIPAIFHLEKWYCLKPMPLIIQSLRFMDVAKVCLSFSSVPMLIR